jgi:hypothetical protein
MNGEELHAKYVTIQAERGLEGTSWEEEGEVGGQNDWNALADHINEAIDEAMAKATPPGKAGGRTD